MRLEVFVTGLALFNLAAVFYFVRQRHLSESFAVLWVGVGVFGLLTGLARPLIDRFADALGIQYGTSLVFAMGILFLLGLVLHLSVHVSPLENQSEVLAKEIALLRGPVSLTEPDDSPADENRPLEQL